MLVQGKWVADWDPIQSKDESGRFIRQDSQFRAQIASLERADTVHLGTSQATSRALPRYHLYVALICPWASRTLMARALLGLQDDVSVSVVEPFLTSRGWRFGDFPGAGPDKELDAEFLHQIYTHSDPSYSRRATVPVLWDRKTRRIVNNESSDIVRMFNRVARTRAQLDLYPSELAPDIDALNEDLYDRLNNGVYRAGFASSQMAYDEAYDDVFSILDELEARFSDGRNYLFGQEMTESDLRLFATLVRFDAAYFSLFKCNRNRIEDMPQLFRFASRMLSLEKIARTVNFEHIRRGYYSVKALNPKGIVPRGLCALQRIHSTDQEPARVQEPARLYQTGRAV